MCWPRTVQLFQGTKSFKTYSFKYICMPLIFSHLSPFLLPNNLLLNIMTVTHQFQINNILQAYRKWVQQHGDEPDLPGLNLTHDQLFFLNYAQIWCGSMRPEDALTKVRSSVHSPGPIRVLGPLSNSWDFAHAYMCPLGSPMNPTDKCNVW